MEILFVISFLAFARLCVSAPTNVAQPGTRKNFIPGRLKVKGATFVTGAQSHIQVIPGTGQLGDPPIISSPGRPQPQPAAAPQGAGCVGAPPDPCNPYGPPPPYGAAPDPYGQYPVQQPAPYGYQQPAQYPVPPPVQPVQYPVPPPVQPVFAQPPPPCGVAPYPC